MSAPLIDVSDIRHRYGDRTVLSLPGWTLEKGQHSLLLGPSGSGKSTLLNILTGLITPSEGRVMVDGVCISTLPPARRDKVRGQLFGIVFQNIRLISALTVRQNLRLARSLAKRPADEKLLEDLMQGLGIAHRADAKPRALSQGEAQRAAIARAAAQNAPILIADEPTSALDRGNAERAIDLLMTVADRTGATLIVATHDDRIRSRFRHVLDLGDTDMTTDPSDDRSSGDIS